MQWELMAYSPAVNAGTILINKLVKIQYTDWFLMNQWIPLFTFCTSDLLTKINATFRATFCFQCETNLSSAHSNAADNTLKSPVNCDIPVHIQLCPPLNWHSSLYRLLNINTANTHWHHSELKWSKELKSAENCFIPVSLSLLVASINLRVWERCKLPCEVQGRDPARTEFRAFSSLNVASGQQAFCAFTRNWQLKFGETVT